MKKKEQSFQVLADKNTDAIIRIDEQLRIKYINSAASSLLRKDVNELLDLKLTETNLSSVFKSELQKLVHKAFQIETEYESSFEISQKKEDKAYYYSRAIPEPDDKNKIVSVLLLIKDITEHKNLERKYSVQNEEMIKLTKQLSDSESIFKTMGDAIDFGVWLCDVNGKARYVSQSFLRLIEMSWEDFQEFGWTERLHPEDRKSNLSRWNYCVKSGIDWEGEYRILGPDGEYHTILSRGKPVRDAKGNIDCWIGINLDITERKEIENELSVKNQHLQGIFDHAPAGIALFDAEEPYRVIEHNREYQKFWPEPFKSQGMVGLVITDYIPDAEKAGLLTVFRKVAESGKGRTLLDFPLRTDGKTPRFWNWYISPVYYEGKLIRFAHMLLDSTETHIARNHLLEEVKNKDQEIFYATQELQKQNDMLQTIIDSIPVMLCFYDPSGRFILINRELEQLTGWSLEDIHKSSNPMELFYPDPTMRSLVWDYMLKAGKEWLTFPLSCKDGSLLESSWVNVKLSDGSQVGIGIDVRETKKNQRELEALNASLNYRARQLQKLAVDLSKKEQEERKRIASLLHDQLQQHLVGAKFASGIILERSNSNQELLDPIEKLKGFLDEAVTISRSLSHDLSPPVLQHGDLNAVLSHLAEEMKEKHGLHVELLLSSKPLGFSETTKTFIFNALRELLFNIVKHAGVLEAEITLSVDEKNVSVSVLDNGKGFDPAHLDAGESSAAGGLGLFSIRERVEILGGDFIIESKIGEGSCFTLRLPYESLQEIEVYKSEEVRTPREEKSKGTRRYRKTKLAPHRAISIVLTDDHRLVRKGLATLLENQKDFYIQAEANNGLEAVEAVRRLGPNVVIMDIEMPHMDGIEATKIIKAEQPETEIIALSIYEEPAIRKKMLQAGASRYLKKDGPASLLIRTIREVTKKEKKERTWN